MLIPSDLVVFVQILQYKKSIVHQPSALSQLQLKTFSFLSLELEEVSSIVNCVKCVPIPVLKQDDPPLIGSWKLNAPPLTAKSYLNSGRYHKAFGPILYWQFLLWFAQADPPFTKSLHID